MAAILAICKVSVGAAPGNRDYYFRGSWMYSEITALTGVSIVKPEDWDNDEPLIPIGALIVAGKIDRLTAPITVGTGAEVRTRYVDIIVAKDKVTAIEAKNSLQGKAYKTYVGKELKTVGTFDSKARQKTRKVRVD